MTSRATQELGAHAAEGRFALQICAECGTVQYPPRDVCVQCLGSDLPWQDVPAAGTVLAVTLAHVSIEAAFRDRLPLPLGLIALDCGPQVLAFLANGRAAGERVTLTLRLDHERRAVLLEQR